MSKKFDVVIGNPPYQEEAQGAGTRDTPVYHLFMDAAYEAGRKAVLITPARFLFNAGFTPKAWNAKMLADPHLSVSHFVPNSDDLFPGTDIKGGIAVTYRDDAVAGDPITTFASHPELNGILQAVLTHHSAPLSSIITSGRAYSYTANMHTDNPQASARMSSDAQLRVSTNAFEQLPFLFTEHREGDRSDHVQVLGVLKNRRTKRWIRADYITGPDSFQGFKVALPAANGTGKFGEVLSTPVPLGPGEAVTQTFITVGNFSSGAEAEACRRYIASKFARALLSVLKITQHNPAKVWRYVPLQDFTAGSDLNWSRSIPQIDQQLYSKYGLTAEQIDFIDTNVTPMD
ncbi:Eco57I restriction-modification methylase domain-containing protein [Parenemella sanctibonifatiensis]|uniref:Restriction endonuclease n=1 Tax=Parenemella sanctibonifatiensis TaxID=2016505 RepID=A0A255EG48_9ACTN|nr:Eco57I restriction-modification methylase domain-containing protein [Parenemella sanctibonifatiensis]OYN90240.1 restriction endonuclease [Parenemella sanctibonifatiensis]